MTLSAFARITWPISLTLELLLLGAMFLRHRAQQFPVLTAYFLFTGLTTLNSVYVYVYRGSAQPVRLGHFETALSELLLLGVFFELSAHVFCPTGVWARDMRRAFALLALGAVVLAGLLTLLDHPVAPTRGAAWELRGYFFACVLLGELFVGTVVLSGMMSLPWKTHVARVAHGLGVYSLICLALNIVSSSIGILPNPHIYVLLNRINSVAWLACYTYLLVMLWREAPAPRELPESMRRQIYRFNEYLEAEMIRVRGLHRS